MSWKVLALLSGFTHPGVAVGHPCACSVTQTARHKRENVTWNFSESRWLTRPHLKHLAKSAVLRLLPKSYPEEFLGRFHVHSDDRP